MRATSEKLIVSAQISDSKALTGKFEQCGCLGHSAPALAHVQQELWPVSSLAHACFRLVSQAIKR